MLHIEFSVQHPISFVSAGTFIREASWIHSERIIDSFEIIIGVEGTLFIQQGDEQFVVREGDMLLLLPGVPHKGYKESEGKTSFFWFHFLLKDYNKLEKEEAENSIWLMAQQTDVQNAQNCILPLFSNMVPDNKLEIIFHQLLHMNKTPCYTHALRDYFLTALLIQLCQNYLEAFKSANEVGKKNRAFAEILEWTRMRSLQPLSVGEAAQRFNYNENYFSRMFRKRTGTYFTDYVNQIRIAKARTLLYRTTLSIKEIAWQVGFADEKYFMKVFKKIEGISPTQYRNAFYLMHQNEQ